MLHSTSLNLCLSLAIGIGVLNSLILCTIMIGPGLIEVL